MIRTPETAKEWESYYDVRYRILRAPFGKEKGSERNDGDESAEHLAYFEGEKILAVARLDKIDATTFQVRFVAVESFLQSKGLGKQIMKACEENAKNQGGTKMILHARDYALPFYEKLNYRNHGPSYKLFDLLQHFEMSKEL